jgi:large conductance mechanosensitive channel
VTATSISIGGPERPGKGGRRNAPFGPVIKALVDDLLTPLIAAGIFFFVIRPVNAFTQRMRKEPTPDPTTRKCPECLSEIPLAARRCAHCTSEVPAAA